MLAQWAVGHQSLIRMTMFRLRFLPFILALIIVWRNLIIMRVDQLWARKIITQYHIALDYICRTLHLEVAFMKRLLKLV